MKKPRLKIEDTFTVKAIVIKAMTKLQDHGLYLRRLEFMKAVNRINDREIVLDIASEYLEIEK